MQSVKALRRWLVFVALLRLLAVFLGYTNHTKFQSSLFVHAPAEGATLFSFVAALCFFLLELLVYQTVSWKSALSPLIIAGVSTLWMGAGWNYYTSMTVDQDFSTFSEPETESAKLE